MALFIALGLVALLMTLSDKLWGNPLSFIGVGFLGFCTWLLVGVVQAGMSAP